jgi:hypothetical protein
MKNNEYQADNPCKYGVAVSRGEMALTRAEAPAAHRLFKEGAKALW